MLSTNSALSFSGLFSFASTTFILSLYNLQTRGIHTPNVVVGMAIFCGGLVQLLAGMWEFPRGNAFGATGLWDLFSILQWITYTCQLAFASYGAFWMAYATILIPGSGVISAYSSEKELGNALGIFLIAWFMVTFFILWDSVSSLSPNVTDSKKCQALLHCERCWGWRCCSRSSPWPSSCWRLRILQAKKSESRFSLPTKWIIAQCFIQSYQSWRCNWNNYSLYRLLRRIGRATRFWGQASIFASCWSLRS